MEYAKTLMNRDLLRRRPRSLGLWRFMELLPVKEGKNVVSLGEGATPLIRAKRLGEILGLKNLYIKDEDVKRFVKSESKIKGLKLHSYWSM